jgi:transcriptional regulator with AAA-type ATPase domain
MATVRQLLSFVDYKDPFMHGEVAGEARPGAILSILDSRPFAQAHLFHTYELRANAVSTETEIRQRWPQCNVCLHELPISDAKNYSSVMGVLAREVRRLARDGGDTEGFVCVSSGTAEIRAAWFLLAASGVVRATLLQVGSPAEPLFGPANVREVSLDDGDWSSLRDLVMPRQYFESSTPLQSRAPSRPRFARRLEPPDSIDVCLSAAAPPAYPGLEDVLQKLGIFVGSAAMKVVVERAAVAASDSDLPVLLLGETGTGKDLFARFVHEMSSRRSETFEPVNCAAIPKDLVESHLFGHVKGAFTGAATDRAGKFVQAHGGTLFLDELGELPLDAQAKLLRVLQDGRVEPVGSSKSRDVDVRIVAATNRDLRQEVAAGRFREDLYYRLEVVEIRLPPLRERAGEIPSLAAALLHRINLRRQKPRQLSKEALRRLEQHSWLGNVRELSNALERSVLYAPADVLGPEDLILAPPPKSADPLSTLPEPEPGFSLESFLARARKQLILRAIEKCGGNQSAAAELLGLTKQAVSKFLKNANNCG